MSMERRITLIGFFTMFVVGVSDLIIVGIISPMSEAFNVHASLIGQLVTVYAISFAFLSPILTKVTSRFEDKKTLLVSLFLFVLVNFLTIFSTYFIFLCLLRIILAALASLVTVKLMALGSKLTVPKKKAKVVANIYVGFSAANILGVPLGTLIVDYLSWQTPFYLIGLISIICLFLIKFFISTNEKKSIESTNEDKQRDYKILSLKGIIIILIFLLLMMISNSLLFTYLEPLIRNANHSLKIVSTALFIAGIAGIMGSKLGNILCEKFGYFVAGSTIIFIYILSLLLLLFYTESVFLMLLSVLLWNLFHWGTNPTVQYALLQFIKGDPSQVFSYNVSILNFGIGIGSILGGILIVKDPSFTLSVFVAIAIALAAFIALFTIRKASIT